MLAMLEGTTLHTESLTTTRDPEVVALEHALFANHVKQATTPLPGAGAQTFWPRAEEARSLEGEGGRGMEGGEWGRGGESGVRLKKGGGWHGVRVEPG